MAGSCHGLRPGPGANRRVIRPIMDQLTIRADVRSPWTAVGSG